MKRPSTLGELKASGYEIRSVKEEMRRNLVRKLREGETLFPGIHGYERTVIPGLVNALLARHDFILLGLRGQAKSRILRALPELLDEEIPILAGSDLNESPLQPLTPQSRALLREKGDATRIEWIPRGDRYGEKLATPDVSIADLLGDLDPIKAATHELTYADPRVIHFGIIPRTNRGIFAINELPDLSPRIQVGLLNILEERDLQIRGFPIRIPLDLLMVFSANPEDYTNRGAIITPLKDRISSQVLTHYPGDLATAARITSQEAWTAREADGVEVVIPDLARRLIERIAFAARESELVDQSSGVSARVPISALEILTSNLERRGWLTGDSPVYPRVADLHMLLPALTGKLEMVYEGEQQGPEMVSMKIIGQAVKEEFDALFPEIDRAAGSGGEDDTGPYSEIIAWFADGNTITLSDEQPFSEYEVNLEKVPELFDLVERETSPSSPRHRAFLAELLLDGLHQNLKLGRDDMDREISYKEMVKFQLLGPRRMKDREEEDRF